MNTMIGLESFGTQKSRTAIHTGVGPYRQKITDSRFTVQIRQLSGIPLYNRVGERSSPLLAARGACSFRC